MQNSMDLQERRYFLLRAAEYELSISGTRPESMQAKNEEPGRARKTIRDPSQ